MWPTFTPTSYIYFCLPVFDGSLNPVAGLIAYLRMWKLLFPSCRLQWEQERRATLLHTCLLRPRWSLLWALWASSSGACRGKRILYGYKEEDFSLSGCISVQFCPPTCWGRRWTSWGSWAACCACWEASYWSFTPRRSRKWHRCRTWPRSCWSRVRIVTLRLKYISVRNRKSVMSKLGCVYWNRKSSGALV